MSRSFVSAALTLGALLVGHAHITESAPAPGPYWPRFHGPQGTNISSDTGLLKRWPAEGPKLIWTAKGIGRGFSSVTIANGLLYTSGNVGEKTVVTALDLNGRTKWQADNGKSWANDPGGTRGTPTIDGNTIYCENPFGDVICLNAKSGKKLWDIHLLDEFQSKNITWGLAESVLIDGNRLIASPCGPSVSAVALDKRTGKTLLRAQSANGDLAGYASPVLVKQDGLRILLIMTAKALVGLNADTGDLLFRHSHETAYDVNATDPIYHDGQVFITSGYGSGSEMLRLQVEGKKASVEKLWSSKELDNHHGGVVLLDGYLYGAAHNANNGKWICLDWKTGEMKYAERGVGKGSLTCAEGMLYTLSEQRNMGLVQATPDGHKVISQFKVPSGGEGPSWAHPVVCGGRLYVRHDDTLYAYDLRAQ